jgi:hypothetical protein
MDALAAADGFTIALPVTAAMPSAPPPGSGPLASTPVPPATDDLLSAWPGGVAVAPLAAQQVAEMWPASADDETKPAAHIRQLRDWEDAVATLTRQLATARIEQARLVARVHELEQERDTLAARVQALETTPAASAEPPARTEPVSALGQLSIIDPHRYGLPLGASFALLPSATIGRHPNSSIPLEDHYVSAHHAQLTREEDGWWVTDLGTKNGTFVNEIRVNAPTRLGPGDTLRFGRVRATFV